MLVRKWTEIEDTAGRALSRLARTWPALLTAALGTLACRAERPTFIKDPGTESASAGAPDPNDSSESTPSEVTQGGKNSSEGGASGTGGSGSGGGSGGGGGSSLSTGGMQPLESDGGSPSESCENEGAFRCMGEAQTGRETCAKGIWSAGASCASDETCTAASGTCGKILAECTGRRAGERYCQSNALVECGPDLQTKTTMACSGKCAEDSGSSACVPPACGDGVRTSDEACDDGNTTSGDGCSAACKLEPVEVISGGQQACALATTGALRCWGDNASGELGLGDKRSRGTLSTDMGAALKGPDLGSHTVKRVATGLDHTCAILDDSSLRCWGSNGSGRLGQGDTTNRGDDSGEMGAALPVTSLGNGITVADVAAGETHTCAILTGGRVKCWGDNTYGQLGIGSTDAQGDQAGEMGDTLPAVNLGPGRTAKQISLGVGFTCVVLDTELVKCWGNNDHGQLGRGDLDARGDDPSEMGSLTPIDLGSGVLVRTVAAGWNHTCALLKDGSVKCWGANDLGQLGLGDTRQRGDEPGEMGTALGSVNLGRSAIAIAAGYNHTCALLDDKTVKCWGGNGLGQLGLGDTNHRGDAPDELGAKVDLGSGANVRSLRAGKTHTCALLEGGTLRCWGNNAVGQLGVGSTTNHGATSGTMGSALPAVNLEF
jgi:cysteine-rich repeat protein